MGKLEDVVGFVWSAYPHKNELSRTRLTKMIYLADWKSALDRGTQITGLDWVFNHHGPYVDDITRALRADSRFELVETLNAYGRPKTLIRLRGMEGFNNLTSVEREILQFVVNATAPKNYRDFVQLVYSTYPIATQQRYSQLDLVTLARQYSALRSQGAYPSNSDW